MSKTIYDAATVAASFVTGDHLHGFTAASAPGSTNSEQIKKAMDADLVALLNSPDAVVSAPTAAHAALTDNPHSVTKAQVGLANADNTSDADKPISAATQSALDAKASVLNSEVVVSQASDLSGALLSTKVYVIDGIIDMGAQAITVPSAGLHIRGVGITVSCLRSNQASYTMFVDAADDAGDLFIEELQIEVTGTSSQVFDLDNSGAGGAVEIINTNFTSCTSLGELDAFRQFFIENSFWDLCADGLTFSGAWTGGARITSLIVRNFGTSGIAFREGTTLTFASRFFSNANIEVPLGAIGYSFSASVFTQDADFELIDGEYSGAGLVTSAILPSSVKSRWRGNNGILNTYVGSRWALATEVTTTIASPDTPVLAAGITAYADEQWFTNSSDNAFVYASTRVVEVEIKGSLNFSASNNDQIGVLIRQWDDSASAYVLLHDHGDITTNGSGRGENVFAIAYAILELNDRVEVWIENRTDSSNITMNIGSLLSVTERAN